MSDEPMKVAGQTVVLELPARMAHRIAIGSAARDPGVVRYQHSAVPFVAAALLLCWPTGMAKAQAEGVRYRHDLLDFGADAIDFFFAQGAAKGQTVEQTRREVIAAGNAALEKVQASLITSEDLEEARGNSRPTPDSSSGSSTA